MASLQPVRGTHDLLPDAMRAHQRIVDTARDAVERYGYDEIATPIFEFSQVFQRTLGDASDIVTKETYTFTDKGGDSLTLRPENTASVARCIISGGLVQQTPLRYFYAGPMFRHERPQKGRLRQFHQIGVELVGLAQPEADVEVIAAGARVLQDIGVRDKTTLEINTLGDPDSRAAYRAVLVEYLSDHHDALSEDSRDRLDRNPLRILDSKNKGDRAIVEGAPSFLDYLNEESVAFFDAVRRGLDDLNIAYLVNPRLVRGLDYYAHTAFEFVTTELGAQGTVMAGGRYDGLIKTMGGPETPGVGWAAGIERLALLCETPPPARRPVSLVPIGADAERHALKLAENLRDTGLRVDLAYSGNVGRRMKRANRVSAAVAVMLGEDEMSRGAASVRDMDTGEQQEVPLDTLADALDKYR
jgi:histidyl-tRNA synthetase